MALISFDEESVSKASFVFKILCDSLGQEYLVHDDSLSYSGFGSLIDNAGVFVNPVRMAVPCHPGFRYALAINPGYPSCCLIHDLRAHTDPVLKTLNIHQIDGNPQSADAIVVSYDKEKDKGALTEVLTEKLTAILKDRYPVDQYGQLYANSSAEPTCLRYFVGFVVVATCTSTSAGMEYVGVTFEQMNPRIISAAAGLQLVRTTLSRSLTWNLSKKEITQAQYDEFIKLAKNEPIDQGYTMPAAVVDRMIRSVSDQPKALQYYLSCAIKTLWPELSTIKFPEGYQQTDYSEDELATFNATLDQGGLL